MKQAISRRTLWGVLALVVIVVGLIVWVFDEHPFQSIGGGAINARIQANLPHPKTMGSSLQKGQIPFASNEKRRS